MWGSLQVINVAGTEQVQNTGKCVVSSWTTQCDSWVDLFTSDQSTGLVEAHNKCILEPTILVFMPCESNLLAITMSVFGLKEVYQ